MGLPLGFVRCTAAAGSAAAAAAASTGAAAVAVRMWQSRVAAATFSTAARNAAAAAAAAARAATPPTAATAETAAAATATKAAAAGAAATAAGAAATAAPAIPRFFMARPFISLLGDAEPAEPEADWLNPQLQSYSSFLFRQPIAAHPVIVAQTIHRLPRRPPPQVAFVGHSNCGKSSLINGLLFGREVARTSRTAGRTRHLFLFELGSRLTLVDLPGYGFAKVDPLLKRDWAVLVEEYLQRSTQLRLVLCLVDAAAGVRQQDLEMWRLLLENKKPFVVAVTKVDLLSAFELHHFMLRLQQRLLLQQQEHVLQPFAFAVSAKQDLGLNELRCFLAAHTAPKQPAAAAAGKQQKQAAAAAAAAKTAKL
uniref:EngB-type G domain-containing protein n=1 Tax=Eimeria tenella TaxID=5802 RepID=H9B9X4_EIMTE|nr:hypothetical protein [Eimeria tenella]